MLVACYDHRHKPEVAHHVEVPPGSALPLTPNDSQASLVVTIDKVGGVSTLRFVQDLFSKEPSRCLWLAHLESRKTILY